MFNFNGPDDAQGGIVITESAFDAGSVEFAGGIISFGPVGQRQITMCKHFGHIDCTPVGRRQFGSEMLHIGWAVWTQIDDHIIDRA